MFWRRNNPLSLAGRMTLLYTLSATAILLLATLFLYGTLANNLQEEETRSLAGRIGELRQVLRTHPLDAATLLEEIQLEGTGVDSSSYFFRIFHPNGALLVASPGMEEIFASASFPSAPHPMGQVWQGENGKIYLLLTV